jgi:hypothetical protein
VTVAIALIGAIVALTATAAAPAAPSKGSLLVSGLQGGSGSTVGPDGALYVPETVTGSIWRVDPESGDRTLFATGLPAQVVSGLGGVMDVAFIGNTAYALVTLVGVPDVLGCGGRPVGIYRVDGPFSASVVADIGDFACDHTPDADIFVLTGVQYALDVYRGGFLVTDGHHNRVYQVTRDGEISEFMTFGNVVPTGLAVSGNTVYMAEAGPLPHLPASGKVVALDQRSSTATEVASGAPLLVDVELGRGRDLFALSQGTHNNAEGPGSPADPDTGSLVKVNGNGGFTTVATGLDRPSSLEIIGTTAYVVTLTGQIWKIDDVSGPPFGH